MHNPDQLSRQNIYVLNKKNTEREKDLCPASSFGVNGAVVPKRVHLFDGVRSQSLFVRVAKIPFLLALPLHVRSGLDHVGLWTRENESKHGYCKNSWDSKAQENHGPNNNNSGDTNLKRYHGAVDMKMRQRQHVNQYPQSVSLDQIADVQPVHQKDVDELQ